MRYILITYIVIVREGAPENYGLKFGCKHSLRLGNTDKELSCPENNYSQISVDAGFTLKFFRFVHGTCDPEADLATYHQRKESHPEYEYVCLNCKNLTQPGRQLLAKKNS